MSELTKITVGELLEALSECAQNKADLKALITELCDALERWIDSYIAGEHDLKLLQRAREAAR